MVTITKMIDNKYWSSCGADHFENATRKGRPCPLLLVSGIKVNPTRVSSQQCQLFQSVLNHCQHHWCGAVILHILSLFQVWGGRSPREVGDKFGDEFVTKIGDKFGVHQIRWQIWWRIWWQIQWAPNSVIHLSPNLVSYLVTNLVFTKFGDNFVTE